MAMLYMFELTNRINVQGINQVQINSDSQQHSKLSNKLQLQALILFFRSFPFLPSLPFVWCRKEHTLFYKDCKLTTVIFLGFVILFEGILCELLSSYLLWNEFMVPENEHSQKLGMKKSLFLFLYAIGMWGPIQLAIFFIVARGKDLCYDYCFVSNFQNYIEKAYDQAIGKVQKKPKIDIVGLMTFTQAQGFVVVAYLLPMFIIYYRMDPTWELCMAICPDCVNTQGHLSSDLLCRLLFLGVRPIVTSAWIIDGCRLLGFTYMLGWIFFDMFNQISGKLDKFPNSSQAIRLYWAFCKVSAGFKYWAGPAMAIAIYGGVSLLSVTNYATIMVLPKVNPLTPVYMVFPMCSFVGTVGLFLLPYAVKYPAATEALIEKWKYEPGCEGKSFRWRLKRKEFAAMRSIVGKLGEFHLLDKDLVTQVLMTLIDQTVNMAVTFPV